MNTAIVYFSREGSTKIACEYLSKKFSASLIELKTEKPLKRFLGLGYLSAAQKTVELSGNPWDKTADADVIVLAAPIWAGNGNPILNSYIVKADFTDTKVYVLTLQADPAVRTKDKVHTHIKKLIESKNGQLIDSLAIHGAKPNTIADDEHIVQQLKDWEIG